VVYVIAQRLELPLDVIVTRKSHIPWNREARIGATSWDGLMSPNEPLVTALGPTKKNIDRCVTEEKEVIKRRMKMFRGRSPFYARGRIVKTGSATTVRAWRKDLFHGYRELDQSICISTRARDWKRQGTWISP